MSYMYMYVDAFKKAFTSDYETYIYHALYSRFIETAVFHMAAVNVVLEP